MRRWGQFALCLVLSFGIWLIHNLSQTYADVVNVPVNAESNIEGRAAKAGGTVIVVARCMTNGFRLKSLAHSRKPVNVFFNPEDLIHKEGDIYTISAEGLYKYSPEIFGDGVTLDALLQNVEFRFPEETHRKVPVVPVSSLTFRPQYMALNEIRAVPDSVTVYGDPSRIRNIDAVVTWPFSHKDLRHSVHGKARLEIPSGTRLSDTEVSYVIDVTRYVELRSKVKIGTRNVPAGTSLSLYPSTADVVYKCVFPTGSDPARNVEFFIDYNEFAVSLTGKCVIRGDGFGSGIISYDVYPEVCDCFVRSSEEDRL